MSWVAPAIMAGSSLIGSLGGGGSSSSSQQRLPESLQRLLDRLAGQGMSLTNQGYTPYTGDRLADLSPLELQAISMAGRPDGSMRYLRRAAAAFGDANHSFTDTDMSKYMSPYIKGALDPAARELDTSYLQDLNAQRSKRSMVSSFGGSRGALQDSELNRAYRQNRGDLYSQGYQGAFQNAEGQFNADRMNFLNLGQGYGALAGQTSALRRSRLQDMLQLGGLERGQNQAGLDIDYQNFQEQRDYPYNNLSRLSGVFSTLAGRAPMNTTSTGLSPNPWSQAIGAGGTLYGYGQQNGWWGPSGGSGGYTPAPWLPSGSLH